MLRTIPAGEAASGADDLWNEIAVDGLPVERASSALRASARPLRAPIEKAPDPDTIICDCLQVRLGTLETCMLRGCTTQAELARETGVTTVCGGCAPRVAEIVGGGSGELMRISEVVEVLPDVRSFRLAPVHPRQSLEAAIPGQHVLVSAMIDGVWVSRPYTLTSPGRQWKYFEITVKLVPEGLLSTWLFKQRPGDVHPIRITPPQGNFQFDLDRSEPIVFLAGGIGITPAITLVRTLLAERRTRLVHIDYSARAHEGFAFREELETVSRSGVGISSRLRVSGNGERITAKDVSEYQWRFPRGRYFICGPESYLAAARSYLDAAGVEGNRIEVEVFTPARPPSPKLQYSPGHWANGVSRVVGLLLLSLYFGQALFEWHWPWLQDIQTVESFRRWSGAVLLAFIVHQWALPILRLRDRFSAPVAAAGYRWHRWAGALAPLFFYAHATWLGFGYLLALGSVYLMNVLIGLLDKTIIPDPNQRDRYARVWLVPHVTLACLTVGLTLLHIFVVFAYR